MFEKLTTQSRDFVFPQIIKGNTGYGNEDVQTRIFDNAIGAKFIRFLPKEWGSVACMRIDICGHRKFLKIGVQPN